MVPEERTNSVLNQSNDLLLSPFGCLVYGHTCWQLFVQTERFRPMCVLADKRGISCHCPDHAVRIAQMNQGQQVKKVMAPGSGPAKSWELVIPNPKLKLLDQIREVMRLKERSTRTCSAKSVSPGASPVGATPLPHRSLVCVLSTGRL